MNPHEKRLRDAFRLLKTQASEWKTCQLIGYEEDEKGRTLPSFEPCLGYAVVAPYSDHLSDEEPTIHEHAPDEGLSDQYLKNCQLCGTKITYPWRIKHDEKKLIMTVGSKCVEEYLNIDVDKTIQEFLLNQILPDLKNWISSATLEISQDLKFAKRKNGNLIYYEGKKHIVKPPYHEYRDRLFKLKINSDRLNQLDFIKVKKLIRRGKTLGLTIPKNLLDAINSTKPQDSESRLALDKYF
jgi:hypothetical protein